MAQAAEQQQQQKTPGTHFQVWMMQFEGKTTEKKTSAYIQKPGELPTLTAL
jgi:hypothetical protein